MTDWKTIRDSIAQELSGSALPPSVKLPVLPQALIEFNDRAKSPDANIETLAQIIASDIGLSTELLRNANACKRASIRKVTSVKQAIIVLGIPKTRLHLTAIGMKKAMQSSSSKLINFQVFWNTNLERSLFAQEIAATLGADRDLAFTAGILQDCLLPLLTNHLLEDYVEFLEHRDSYPGLSTYERQRWGWDHGQAAAQVMDAWNFPDSLVCCVYFHHRGIKILDDPAVGKSAAAAVALASLLPDALRQETDGIETLIGLENEQPEFDLLAMAERVDEQFQTMTTDASNHFPFVRLYQNTVKRLQLQ